MTIPPDIARPDLVEGRARARVVRQAHHERFSSVWQLDDENNDDLDDDDDDSSDTDEESDDDEDDDDDEDEVETWQVRRPCEISAKA